MQLLEPQHTSGVRAGGEVALARLAIDFDGRSIELSSAKLTIGSGPRCNVRIQQPGVQPLHCLIARNATSWSVRRWAGEAQLNGQPFDEASLMPGDRLSVGPVCLTVVNLDSPADVDKAPTIENGFQSPELNQPPADMAGSDKSCDESHDGDQLVDSDCEELPIEESKSVGEVSERSDEVSKDLQILQEQVAELERKLARWEQERSEWQETFSAWERQQESRDEFQAQWLQVVEFCESQIAEHVRRIEALEKCVDERTADLHEALSDEFPLAADCSAETRVSQDYCDERPSDCGNESATTTNSKAEPLAFDWLTPGLNEESLEERFSDSHPEIHESELGIHSDHIERPFAGTNYDIRGESESAWGQDATNDTPNSNQESVEPTVEDTNEQETVSSAWNTEPALDAEASSEQGIASSTAAGTETLRPDDTDAADASNTQQQSFIERYSHLLPDNDESTDSASASENDESAIGTGGASAEDASDSRLSGHPSQSAITDDEESIEQYMAKLLQRVRCEGPKFASESTTSGPAESVKRQNHEELRSAVVASLSSASGDECVGAPLSGRGNSWAPAFGASRRDPSNPAPVTDLAALRALANETARRAISTHSMRKHRRTAATKVIVATLAGLTSLMLMLQSPGWRDVQFIAGCLSLLVAAYWAGQAFRMFLALLRDRSFEVLEDENDDDSPLPIDIDIASAPMG